MDQPLAIFWVRRQAAPFEETAQGVMGFRTTMAAKRVREGLQSASDQAACVVCESKEVETPCSSKLVCPRRQCNLDVVADFDGGADCVR